MPVQSIKFRSGYKYQLAESASIQTEIRIANNFNLDFLSLSPSGVLTAKKGYAWDGPSGPVPDTKRNMRASLFHDALYQLLRGGYLNKVSHKDIADKLFRDICITDGVSPLIADVYYYGLKKAGDYASDPKNKKPILLAP